jgi:hypothetical protein
MALSIQILRVHYQGKTLFILDSDDTTSLYTVHIPTRGLKMSLSHGGSVPHTSPPPYSLASQENTKHSLAPPKKAPNFSQQQHSPAPSTLVTLTVHSRQIALQRENTFNRNYIFTSANREALRWESDGMLSGDWKLVGANNVVRARLRNKVFSTSELGSFEILGVKDEEERDLIVTSGLAVLVIVQSTLLAALVLTGGED